MTDYALFQKAETAGSSENMGILYTGAMNVPLSVKLNPEEIKFRINHSEARMILVSSIQAQKLKEVIKDCPGIEKIIHFDTQEEYAGNEIHFNEVRKIGREWLEVPENMTKFEELFKSLTPSDFANICYTSGTTADPKGIILTHGNYVTNVYQAYSLMDIPSFYKTLTNPAMGPFIRPYLRNICIHGKRSKYCFCKNRKDTNGDSQESSRLPERDQTKSADERACHCKKFQKEY